ncbi:YopJ family acetyltransferase [Candidatus Williamhamiltonella defendens]|nr:YopJ family acetyltransferase [Candidatus Hamiltonella defensa]ATW34758.1 hypothetical protein BJP43_10165 [Candidatus Hamiltonella defensa]
MKTVFNMFKNILIPYQSTESIRRDSDVLRTYHLKENEKYLKKIKENLGTKTQFVTLDGPYMPQIINFQNIEKPNLNAFFCIGPDNFVKKVHELIENKVESARIITTLTNNPSSHGATVDYRLMKDGRPSLIILDSCTLTSNRSMSFNLVNTLYDALLLKSKKTSLKRPIFTAFNLNLQNSFRGCKIFSNLIAKAAAHHEELFSCIHKSIFDREVKLLNNEKFKTPLINEKVIFIPEETVDQLLPIDFYVSANSKNRIERYLSAHAKETDQQVSNIVNYKTNEEKSLKEILEGCQHPVPDIPSRPDLKGKTYNAYTDYVREDLLEQRGKYIINTTMPFHQESDISFL